MKRILAAGAVIWRETETGLEVLLVERTKHKDVSIPKGKLDPGETLPECAVREMLEETGIAVYLGAPVGTSDYQLPSGQEKVVYYWQAQAHPQAIADSTFSPNGEIQALHWLPLATAKGRVSYEHDVHILEAFEANIAKQQLETIAVVALRHGKAADPSEWEGPDAARELTKRGLRQAEHVAPGVAAFGVRRVYASTATRCRQTAEPLAAILGRAAKPLDALAQDSFRGDASEIVRRVEKAVRKERGIVFVTHAPVLPAVTAAVTVVTDAQVSAGLRQSAQLSPAEFSVYHLTTGAQPRLVAFESHCPPE